MPIVPPPSQLSFGGAFDAAPTRRLFFAVQPDVRAADGLTRLIGMLRGDGIALGRVVDADRWHITLILLGIFVDQIPPRLIETARTAAATVRAQPFELAFDHIAGNAAGLRLLASDKCPAFKNFLRILSEALITAGHSRPATSNPHVTLSYGGAAVPTTRVEPIAWTFSKLVLIESLIGKHQHVEQGCWSIQP